MMLRMVGFSLLLSSRNFPTSADHDHRWSLDDCHWLPHAATYQLLRKSQLTIYQKWATKNIHPDLPNRAQKKHSSSLPTMMRNVFILTYLMLALFFLFHTCLPAPYSYLSYVTVYIYLISTCLLFSPILALLRYLSHPSIPSLQMADARHRREALVVHDECIAPPVCDSIAREQKVKVTNTTIYITEPQADFLENKFKKGKF